MLLSKKWDIHNDWNQRGYKLRPQIMVLDIFCMEILKNDDAQNFDPDYKNHVNILFSIF